jgi:tRNA(Leu) C34 or U34 (ribose-2'-O)-methylase TrmL
MSIVKTAVWGKNMPKQGQFPAIALLNPKYARNVGAVVRSASCFGLKQVWFSGNRVSLDGKERLPREERMKGYAEVDLYQCDQFFDQFPADVVPVAVELKEGAEQLHNFEHPEKALYVFGPEDGSLTRQELVHCHRRVVIPSRHCLNLATAVSIVLYDRIMKRDRDGTQPIPPMEELLKHDRACLRDLADIDEDAIIG